MVVVGHPVNQLDCLLGQYAAGRGNGVNLGAITGGEDHNLLQSCRAAAVRQGLAHLRRSKGHSLAHLEVGGIDVVQGGFDRVLVFTSQSR